MWLRIGASILVGATSMGSGNVVCGLGTSYNAAGGLLYVWGAGNVESA
jgi:hypothetical protein